ncbi:MAG TPA: phosphoenolpyruvate--protein phosphotransferase [Methylomirabilota bacterium]|nr:phosphoenolpyruvate--protein phosphotransferase [Methylomirabilota bacterium]
MPEQPRTGERVLRGIPVSAGVCRGPILVLHKSDDCIPFFEITEDQIPLELERFETALVKTRHQILEVQRRVSEAMGADDASIFDAHLLVLEDRMLLDEVSRSVRDQKQNIEHVFSEISRKYVDALDAIGDEYLRERAADMRDVTARVLNNLMERDDHTLRNLHEPCIILSHDLSPSLTATLDKKFVLGFGTEIGGKTSHTAIMARSLQIPAVVGLQQALQQVTSGQYALLDGHNGVLIINPTDQTLFEYGQLVKKHVHIREKLREETDKPAVTLDGHAITLSANVEQPGDTAAVKQSGAEGVGLFRTEYLFLNRSVYPTEQEQYEAYFAVAAALKPQPVVIRTLDLGGDKFLSHVDLPQEMNPFLGWRAIRFCLEEPDIFRVQLRAILRASAEGNVKMMYPMVSCLEELEKANSLVEECKEELRKERVAFDENIEIGVMIEIPSAVMIADTLAKRVKFFSIGSNDLIQYTLAVDRLNEKIAHLYEPTHPAIVRMIKMTAEAAKRKNIWCGVCGEVAGDLSIIPLLLGLGVTELSAAPAFVPQIKYLIRHLKQSETEALAEFALTCDSSKEILRRSQEMARGVAPSLFENTE